MGCIISCCCGSEDDETGEYGERTRLVSECNTQTQVNMYTITFKKVGDKPPSS